jgi:hypothetical protein
LNTTFVSVIVVIGEGFFTYLNWFLEGAKNFGTKVILSVSLEITEACYEAREN